MSTRARLLQLWRNLVLSAPGTLHKAQNIRCQRNSQRRHKGMASEEPSQSFDLNMQDSVDVFPIRRPPAAKLRR